MTRVTRACIADCVGCGLAFLAVAENSILLEGGGATSHTTNVVLAETDEGRWVIFCFLFLFCHAESGSYNAPCAFGPRYFAFWGGVSVMMTHGQFFCTEQGMVLPKTWYEYFALRSSERVKSYRGISRLWLNSCLLLLSIHVWVRSRRGLHATELLVCSWF